MFTPCAPWLAVLLLAAGLAADEAPAPPGKRPWGAGGDRRQISAAQQQGQPADVAAAMATAKRNRGRWLGCPDAAIRYAPVAGRAPIAAEILADWKQVYATALARIPTDRPIPARAWGYTALGAYAARQSGAQVDATALDRFAELAESTQYADANAPWPPLRTPGMYAYVVVAEDDPWFDGTAVSSTSLGRVLLELADKRPGLTAVFDAGPWAGRRFAIADVDPPDWLDGGAAYDHGIAGVAMIEAAIQHADPLIRRRRLASARLACDWAIAEPAVVNANYTAKLVWLLATMYALDGAAADRTALLDKLDRAVLPGVLMDADRDGQVDGVPGCRFADLTAVARVPGRLWDGHNARPVYHAMIAQAVTAAYAALRDRGDVDHAARIKPYALALLDNLAAEINRQGVPDSGTGLIPFAVLHGLWSIDRAEGTRTAAWREALARLWEAGRFRSGMEGSGALGLLLLEASATPYRSLPQRWQDTGVAP